MTSKQMEIRAILQKLSNHKKRKRDDMNDPLVAYCRALLIPHFKSKTSPPVPFEKVQDGVYNIEGNGTYTMLEIKGDTFDLF